MGHKSSPFFSLHTPFLSFSRYHGILWIVCLLVGTVVGWRAWQNQTTPSEAVWAGVVGLLSVYGVWALTRELLAQDTPLALIGIPLVIWILWEGRELSLLVLYSTLLQVRMINRPVGQAAHWLDAFVVCALTCWTMYYTENMLFWFSGMLTFVLDATVHDKRHRAWIFALLCVAVGLYFDLRNIPLMRELGFVTLPPWGRYLFLVAAFGVVGSFVSRHQPVAMEDQQPLSSGRWRASVVVAVFCAITPLFQGNLGLFASAFVWAALAAFMVALVLRDGYAIIALPFQKYR